MKTHPIITLLSEAGQDAELSFRLLHEGRILGIRLKRRTSEGTKVLDRVVPVIEVDSYIEMWLAEMQRIMTDDCGTPAP